MIHFNSVYKTYSNEQPTSSTSTTEQKKENLPFEDDLDDAFNFEDIHGTPKTFINESHKELEDYLQAPRASLDTNILDSWKLHLSVYPTISKMARDFLCIPATSVSGERVFSEAGSVVRKTRCRLSKNKVRALVSIN